MPLRWVAWDCATAKPLPLETSLPRAAATPRSLTMVAVLPNEADASALTAEPVGSGAP
jgi:hypothetical protein